MPPLGDSLALLAAELLDGPAGECYVLNKGDAGLLSSLDHLSAAAASAIPASGGASIAAHVDHVLYGLRLLNRWVGGEENPWADADWTASWKRTSVTDDEWSRLREQFRARGGIVARRAFASPRPRGHGAERRRREPRAPGVSPRRDPPDRSLDPRTVGRAGGFMIRKLANGRYRLYSRKKDQKTGRRRNLGTFTSRAAAERHERAVQFFKRR